MVGLPGRGKTFLYVNMAQCGIWHKNSPAMTKPPRTHIPPPPPALA
jgi:hypothetical protein